MAVDMIARGMALAAAEGGSVDAYTRAETDALLDGKVDAVQGKGLSENDYTDAEKAKLAGAAQQATTYTKGEVDAALAEKLDAADIDDALSSTSTNPVQNKAVQAPVAMLVDAGAKNIFPYGDLMGITTNFRDKPLVLPKGAYKLIFHESATSGSFAVRIKDALDNSIFYVTESNTNADHAYDVEISVDGATITIYSSVSNDFANIMICATKDYAISSDFVPYAKSNYELTQDVEPIPRLVDAGAKNLFKMRNPATISTHGVNFVINTDGTIDLSTDDNGATEQTDLSIGEITTKSGINYVWNGCPLGGSPTTYRLMISTSVYDEGNGYAFTSLVSGSRSPFIRVYPGTVIKSPVKFYPMLCTAEDYAISPEFVPYAPSNRELYEMILALQNAQNGG